MRSKCRTLRVTSGASSTRAAVAISRSMVATDSPRRRISPSRLPYSSGKRSSAGAIRSAEQSAATRPCSAAGALDSSAPACSSHATCIEIDSSSSARVSSSRCAGPSVPRVRSRSRSTTNDVSRWVTAWVREPESGGATRWLRRSRREWMGRVQPDPVRIEA